MALLNSTSETTRFRRQVCHYPGTCTRSEKRGTKSPLRSAPKSALTTRIGTVSKPEMAQSRNGTPVTFAARQRFITLRQPLENMRRLSPTRQNKIFFALGSSGKGIRDGWDEEFFSREIHQHRGLVLGDFPVVGLWRWHECWGLGINRQRNEDHAREQHGSCRRQHAVFGHGHRKHESGSDLVGKWSCGRQFDSRHDRRERHVSCAVECPRAEFGEGTGGQRRRSDSFRQQFCDSRESAARTPDRQS